MNELSGLLHDIAEQVPGYDVGTSALRIARRRRKLRRIAPAALPLVLVAAIAAVWLPLHRNDSPPDSAVSWLPSRITAPDASIAELPTDLAVGAAAMVYTPCPQDCWRIVVLRDGTQYRLATPGKSPTHKLSAGLSPDGRWVAYPDANDDLVLRDLTSATTSTFAGMRPRAWSPDGRYLALAPVNTSDSPTPYPIVDLSTGSVIRTVTVRPSAGGSRPDLAGILDDGRLIWVSYEFTAGPPPDARSDPQAILPKSARVQFTDPEGQRILNQWDLQPPEGSGYWFPTSAILPMPDGKLLVRFTTAYPWGYSPGSAAVVDAASGAVLAQYRVPAATAEPLDVWSAAGLAGGRLVVVHGRAKQPQVALLGPGDGRPQPVCLVEGGYGVPVLPGNA